MTAAALKKGWCPTLLHPMQSGDGLLVRIKPRAASLSAEQAFVLADLAALHGNGQIDLTARANLQLRGLTQASAAPLAEAALQAELADADPDRERIRNIIVSPLGADDCSAEADSASAAAELEIMLREPVFAGLPDKFGFAIDTGGALPLGRVRADILIRARADRFELRLDGGSFVAVCAGHNLRQAARRLALAFLELAGTATRMIELVDRDGELAVFAAAGLAASLPRRGTSEPAPPIGPLVLGDGRAAYGAGLAFGRIDAAALRGLAALAVRFGDATLRLTPWRALLLVGIAPYALPELAGEIAGLGLITDPQDPRRVISACVGKPACRNAATDARADARRLAELSALAGRDIHVSACAKGCAHPAPAAITLTGRDGLYDLVRNGRASDRAERSGLSLDEAITILTRETA